MINIPKPNSPLFSSLYNIRGILVRYNTVPGGTVPGIETRQKNTRIPIVYININIVYRILIHVYTIFTVPGSI